MSKARLYLCAASFAVLSIAAASAADLSREWPDYGHDAGDSRFSPLTQITPGNVARLQKVWTFHMRPASLDVGAPQEGVADPEAGPPRRGRRASRFQESEMTPLVVNGLMILATPYERVVAINATTGAQVWAYDLPKGDAPAMRGVEYWAGPSGNKNGGRIVIATRAGRLIEISARTGEPSPGFGSDGVIDIKTPDVMNGYPKAQYGFSAPALIFRNLIVTGSRVQEGPMLGAAGDIRAWDAVSGKLVWTFHSVPRPGELGHDTWEGDSWKGRSGVNEWMVPVADVKRGIVYVSFGAPSVDRWGGDRHGANLFSNAVVALNGETGKYLWHFQAVHHDIWDLDLPSQTLIDVKKGGKTIPAIAVMDKMGLIFMLDRVTGKPVHDVKEVPVPAVSDIPDEQVWPTQPMSVTPPLGRTSFDLSELATVTPELHDFCAKLVKDRNITPSKLFLPLSSTSATASFPGRGTVQWGGAAFDSRRGVFVANSNNLATATQLVKQPDGSYGMKDGYAYFWKQDTRQPCQQPPWGNLNAVDVNTGKIKWQVTLGVSDDLPAGQQNTGRYNIGNPMMTAGGLIFIGATDDNRFRAFDTETGKELWTEKLPAMANTGPISYQGKDGRQYIAVVATGGAGGAVPATADDVIAYALAR